MLVRIYRGHCYYKYLYTCLDHNIYCWIYHRIKLMKKDKKKKDNQKKQKQDDSRKYLEKMRYSNCYCFASLQNKFHRYNFS